MDGGEGAREGSHVGGQLGEAGGSDAPNQTAVFQPHGGTRQSRTPALVRAAIRRQQISSRPFSHFSSDHLKGNAAVLISTTVYLYQKRSVNQNQRLRITTQKDKISRGQNLQCPRPATVRLEDGRSLPVLFRVSTCAWAKTSGTPAGERVQHAVDALEPETEEQKEFHLLAGETVRVRRDAGSAPPNQDGVQ